MKTRLQLVSGYIAGTLTPEEETVAKENPVVLAEITRVQAEKYEAAKMTSLNPKHRRGAHGRLETS